MTFDEPEGATPLDPDEKEGLKFGHITTRAELDELEQANIEQGLAWVSRRRTGSIFDDTFIRRLHAQLFGDVWSWAGEYRLTEKNIGIDPFQIPVQLRVLLGNAQYQADHGVYRPLEAAARFHHRMVQIHPFPNGNGRHARIAADILLEEVYDHPPVEWASGFDLQADNERRNAYIASLRAADSGDFNPLLVFVGAADDPD
ncbi:mobile mystery protein B [Chromatocurvus halotolerans]|uniref:Fic-DOC domain mobile mystery protein B n=1 Tax=Chromatocurvus halotolerans TaxID=1132028 RepID=A0A4R2KG40_9GAMM|nr:mobile mystery protein B [Chromatocurvus halotolerans]TCO69369.1 Fic-DOC domain mobile mystery protein B [Chromatocurvus halotolerans]